MAKSKEEQLDEAIFSVDVERVQQLIEAGADIKNYTREDIAFDLNGEPYLDKYTRGSHLTYAAEITPENEKEKQAKYAIIRALIYGGADVNEHNHLYNSIYFAKDLDIWAVKIFVDNGYDLNIPCYSTGNDGAAEVTNFIIILREACTSENPDQHKSLIKLLLASSAEISDKPIYENLTLSSKQMAEQLLGSEMPKLIETPENEVHSIYRQEGAKTFDELALEIQTKRFSNAANIMGAGIISKSGMKDGDSPNTVLQNALITNNFADNCLNKNDIRNLSQVAKDDVYGNTLPVTYIDEVTKAMQKQQIDLGNFDRATELQLQRFNVTSVAIGR